MYIVPTMAHTYWALLGVPEIHDERHVKTENFQQHRLISIVVAYPVFTLSLVLPPEECSHIVVNVVGIKSHYGNAL